MVIGAHKVAAWTGIDSDRDPSDLSEVQVAEAIGRCASPLTSGDTLGLEYQFNPILDESDYEEDTKFILGLSSKDRDRRWENNSMDRRQSVSAGGPRTRGSIHSSEEDFSRHPQSPVCRAGPQSLSSQGASGAKMATLSTYPSRQR